MLGVHPGNTTIAPDILRGCLLKYTRSVIASSISATSFLDAVRCLLVTLRSELGGGLVMVFFLFRERASAMWSDSSPELDTKPPSNCLDAFLDSASLPSHALPSESAAYLPPNPDPPFCPPNSPPDFTVSHCRPGRYLYDGPGPSY